MYQRSGWRPWRRPTRADRAGSRGVPAPSDATGTARWSTPTRRSSGRGRRWCDREYEIDPPPSWSPSPTGLAGRRRQVHAECGPTCVRWAPSPRAAAQAARQLQYADLDRRGRRRSGAARAARHCSDRPRHPVGRGDQRRRPAGSQARLAAAEHGTATLVTVEDGRVTSPPGIPTRPATLLAAGTARSPAVDRALVVEDAALGLQAGRTSSQQAVTAGLRGPRRRSSQRERPGRAGRAAGRGRSAHRGDGVPFGPTGPVDSAVAPTALVAQWIEHLTTDQKVGGSTPSERADHRSWSRRRGRP